MEFLRLYVPSQFHKLKARKAMERGSTMNIEKDIPDYAMVPAKQIEEKKLEPISSGAIYTPIEVTNVLDGQRLSFIIEEDILVPDIKPDLREILIMEGTASLSARELNGPTTKDEYTTLAGELCLQSLYCPEKPNPLCPIVSIESKIPFKEQCKLNDATKIIASCEVEKIDYMIVNERKYRIKATIVITTKEYQNITLNIFDGLKNEELHILKQKAELMTLAVRKKDLLSIKEYISPINDTLPGQILFKDIYISENYKQITADKIILNGFVGLNILYCDKSPISDLSLADNIHQIQEKVEFTQFIPLQHMQGSSFCNVTFDESSLKLRICQHEDGQDIIQLEGDIITYVELYKITEKDIIVDGYHKEKDFVFKKKETNINVLVGSSNSDSSVREIFVPKQSISPDAPGGELDSDVESILFTTGSIVQSKHHFEQGKIITEGIILAKIVCQLTGDESKIVTVCEEVPYRISSSIANMTGEEVIKQNVYLKDFWSEKINGKQLEFNASIASQTSAIRETSFVQLTEPAFEVSSSKESISPLIIYCCRQNDSLWHIAKKFKTSSESIKEINDLEKDDLIEGQKLLIMR